MNMNPWRCLIEAPPTEKDTQFTFTSFISWQFWGKLPPEKPCDVINGKSVGHEWCPSPEHYAKVFRLRR